MLLLLLQSPAAPPSPAFVNAASVIADLWPPLNARSAADAVFWTDAEMYEWFNEGARKLSGYGPFVVRDTSISVADGTPLYNLPNAHQATLQADLAGVTLRPRTVQELEALDSAWPATSGTPKAFLLDTQGAKTIRPYPIPDIGSNGDTLGLVMRSLPADVAIGSGYLLASPAMREFFTFYILGEARTKESRAQMPEIAGWFKSLAQMYLQAVQGYMGGNNG